MKHLSIITLFSLLLFTSCSDSPEKLAEDQISYLEEMTELINDIADGKVSSSEGAKKIKKWGEKGEKIQERIKALRKDGVTDEEFTKAGEKYKERSQKALSAYLKAVTKLRKSGRATKELQDAMLNVK